VRWSCVVVGRGCEGVGGIKRFSDVRHSLSTQTTLVDALAMTLQLLLLNDQARQQALLSASETILRNRGATQRILPYVQLALSEKRNTPGLKSRARPNQ